MSNGTMDRTSEIESALRLLHQPGDVFEVRCLDGKRVDAGCFDDFGAAARAVLAANRWSGSVYVTLNPVDRALLARANNRLKEWSKSTTADKDITRRQWILFDIDPDRPSDIPATDAELQAARDVGTELEDALRARGWPVPLLVDSGNGVYLLYSVDLPNDAEAAALTKGVLAGAATLLSEPEPGAPRAHVDPGVFNAARIIRVGGSENRKGDGTPDRPHRQCVYHAPDPGQPIEVVDVELLREVAALAKPAEPRSSNQHTGNGCGGNGHASPIFYAQRRLAVDRYLQHYGIEYRAEQRDGCAMFVVPCPFDPAHGHRGETAIYQRDDGLLTFECKHSSCSDRRWGHYRDAVGQPQDDHFDGPAIPRPHRAESHYADADYGGTPEAADHQAETPEKVIDFGLISAAEMLRREYHVEELVEGALIRGQHWLLAGVLKGCKSLTAGDLAISLAAAVPWLRHFQVRRQVKTLLLSGESGWPVLQSNVRRIARAAETEFGQVQAALETNLVVGVKLPKLGRPDYMAALSRVLKEQEIEVCILDCAYRAIPGDNVSNLFAMGELLDSIGEVFEECGSTLVLIHHSPKHIPPGEPLQLDNVAFAGFSEFAAGWTLINRQQPYESGSGLHQLWMTIGSRAGVGGTYSLRIDEGEYQAGVDRKWDVEVQRGDEARQERLAARQREAELRRAEKAEAAMQATREAVLTAALKLGRSVTREDVLSRVTGNRQQLLKAFTQLIDDGALVHDGETRSANNRITPTYRVNDDD